MHRKACKHQCTPADCISCTSLVPPTRTQFTPNGDSKPRGDIRLTLHTTALVWGAYVVKLLMSHTQGQCTCARPNTNLGIR